MTPVDFLLSKLPDAKRQGKEWVARCPAHDDKRPSLSISEGEDGRALVHCHAGCKPEEILAALGMKLADLMPETPARPIHAPKRKTTAKAPTPATFRAARDAVAALDRRHGPRAAMWTYRDAGSEPVGVVIRWDTPTGKTIRPVSKISTGWVIGAMPDPRPLYRLPELLTRSGEQVVVCEGEKATDAAAGLGLLATTSIGGAKAAGKSDWTPLAGREVVILPDHDEAGKRYAADVTSVLAKLTPPATVRIVDLADAWPDLPEGGDIADLVERGEDHESIKAKLGSLVDSAEPEAQPRPAPAVEPFKPFPTDALPRVIAKFVNEASVAIGCDPAYVAMPMMAALASAVGNSRRIRLKNSWTEPPVLWCVAIGDSGTLKSPAFDAALRPIRIRQERAMKEHKQALAKYRDEKERYDEALKAWRKSDPEERSDKPEEPEPPVCERLLCSDTTVEALADRLSDARRGLLVARDELSGWLESHNQYKNGKGGDVPHWLEMHRAGLLVMDRKTGDKTTIYVPRASVCITGGIQPETLRRCLTPDYFDNGLAARLLLAMPPRREKRWTEADVDGDTVNAVDKLFDELLKLQPSTDSDGEPEPVDVKLTERAKALWVDFYNQHAKEQTELGGALSAAWSKLEGYAVRLALIVHCVRQASGEPVDPLYCDEVSMAAGIALADWFGHEAKRVYGVLRESEEDRDRRRLVELIDRKGGAVTVRELQQASRLFRTAGEAEIALDDLAQAGAGRWEQQGPGAGGGRPTRIFRLNSPAASQPARNRPPAPTKPSFSIAPGGFVDVGAVDGREAERQAYEELSETLEGGIACDGFLEPSGI